MLQKASPDRHPREGGDLAKNGKDSCLRWNDGREKEITVGEKEL
jgi:hypothetical protein